MKNLLTIVFGILFSIPVFANTHTVEKYEADMTRSGSVTAVINGKKVKGTSGSNLHIKYVVKHLNGKATIIFKEMYIASSARDGLFRMRASKDRLVIQKGKKIYVFLNDKKTSKDIRKFLDQTFESDLCEFDYKDGVAKNLKFKIGEATSKVIGKKVVFDCIFPLMMSDKKKQLSHSFHISGPVVAMGKFVVSKKTKDKVFMEGSYSLKNSTFPHFSYKDIKIKAGLEINKTKFGDFKDSEMNHTAIYKLTYKKEGKEVTENIVLKQTVKIEKK